MHQSLVFLAKRIGVWEQGTMSCGRLYNEDVWKTFGEHVFPSVWVQLGGHSGIKTGLHCEPL